MIRGIGPGSSLASCTWMQGSKSDPNVCAWSGYARSVLRLLSKHERNCVELVSKAWGMLSALLIVRPVRQVPQGGLDWLGPI